MASEAGFFGRHKNVYLYVPNLIGYARIVLALLSYGLALQERYAAIAVLAYLGSFVCDELDGRFARMLNQTSTLGAVLDMVTDRVGTSGLLALLCVLYPSYHIVFLLLITLDIFSHWFQMYATLLRGDVTHKDSKSKSWIVRMYYKHRLFMGFCCVCCEVLYLALYMLHWSQFRSPAWMAKVLPPGMHAEPWASQLLPGDLVAALAEGRVPVALVLALAALPGFAIKQVCNWAQLTTAMEVLVQHDQAKKAT